MMPREYPLPSTLVRGGGKIPMIVVYEDRQDDMFKQQGGGGYNRAYKIESTM